MNIKFPKSLLALAGAALLPLSVSAAPDPNFHIYLMVGQSNMEGQGQIEAQDKTPPAQLVVMHDDKNCTQDGKAYLEWRPAVPPLMRCMQTAHSFNNGGLSPGDYFGREMVKGSPGIKVGLVGAAYQGQKIEYFMKNCNPCSASGANGSIPESSAYKWLITMAKKAQEAGVIKGIIFHQGESNAGDSSWPGKVNTMVTDIRTDLGVGDIPFIAGEMVPNACCVSHNAQVQKIPSAVKNGYFVSAQGASKRSDDNYHFDAAGQRLMGKRYAEKMLPLVDVKPVGSSSSSAPSCGTADTGEAVCCKIAADPDGDGWGNENGKVCKVTDRTEGYVKPSSSSRSSSSVAVSSSRSSSVVASSSSQTASSAASSSKPATTGGAFGFWMLSILALGLFGRRTLKA